MQTSYEQQTHRAEERHWWYRGRRRIIHAVLSHLALPARARILDAGCGSGRNMVELARYGTVTGVELSEAALRVARSRGVGEVVQASLEALPLTTSSFDLAVCLDVIEHLDDDRGALRELRRVIVPGGYLIVTVPAYQWLWSNHDVINEHRRRYTRRSLLAVSQEGGWHCERVTYFNSILLPVAAVARTLERLRKEPPDQSLDLWLPPAPLNALLERPLALEAALLARNGNSLRAGLSLLAVLR
jgi:SAM-dependent methyltransferase